MKYTLLPFFLLFAFLIQSNKSPAQGVLSFEKESHDFGDVIEGEQAAHEFTFTNTGNQPVVISNVQASCGCTTPFWTKEPVAPGQKGVIKASYNSRGRLGSFNKSISVTSNGKPMKAVLYIKGQVLDKKPEYTAEEKRLSPKLELSGVQKEFSLGTLERGQARTIKVLVKNTGVKDLEISNVRSACRCVTFTLDKPSIAKGETGTLHITYRPRALGDQKELLTLESNDIVNPFPKFTLKASVVESVSKSSLMDEGGAAVPFK